MNRLGLFLAAVFSILPAFAATTPSELHWVATEDAAWVALHHKAQNSGPAVLLVHGIASNHAAWDLEEGRSLVDHLID